MVKFLQEVAQQILRDNPTDMDKVAVVFNNRRPSLFLRKELIRLNQDKEAFLLPRMMGIDDLVSDMCDWQLVPSEFLLFDLFDIHRILSHSDERFEDFISFGETMLHDFAEIDLYHVDAAKLFDNLGELKAIGEWDVSNPTLNASSQHYLQFYKSLYQYYTMLRKRLASQYKAYRGMAYREVADHIEELENTLNYTRIYFVGFSVLSTCERAIIEHFIKNGKGVLIADGDSYYVNDSTQEAGELLRQLKDLLPSSFSYPSHLAAEEKQIHLVSCPENLMQVKYAGNLLDNKAMEETCVVLADENLLVPMLNSLPDSIKKVNVTMGLPFTQSAPHTLISRLLQLYAKAQGNRFYHKDLFEFFSDPNINLLAKHLSATNIQHYLVANKLVFATANQVIEMCHTLHINLSPLQFIFSETEAGSYNSPNLFLERCKELLLLLQQHQNEQNRHSESEAISCGISIIDHLISLQDTYNYINDLSTLERIFNRLAQRHKIALIGEPLDGMQLLGVLETRCLDFDHIIILSVNESIIPSGKSNSSLIPFTLRRAHNIPTYAERDAIFAYHFYHMLQRASDITLIYHTETEAAGKGEPSRFITQLKAELAARYSNIHIDSCFVSPSITPTERKSLIQVDKDNQVMRQLREKAEQGFSPSALNLYLKCPMQFYYQYILHIKEEKDVEETLQSNEFGTLVHDIAEHIYSNYINKSICTDDLTATLSEVEKWVDETFAEKYQKGRSANGENYYLRAIAKAQISNLLNSEIAQLQQGNTIQIVQLEEELHATLSLSLHNENITVNFLGKADRIDRYNGQLRVIDYKTGSVKSEELCFPKEKRKATESDKSSTFSDKWLQLMIYAWMYHKNHPHTSIQSGIYATRNTRVELLKASWNKTDILDNNILEDFQSLLIQIITPIMDREQPFVATPSKNNCQYCLFHELCSVSQKGK